MYGRENKQIMIERQLFFFLCCYWQKMKPENDQEENELVILHLRQLCETKQKTHIHIGEAPSVKLVFVLFLSFLPPY